MCLIHGRDVSNLFLLSPLSLTVCLFFLNHCLMAPNYKVCFCLCTPLCLWRYREKNGLNWEVMTGVTKILGAFISKLNMIGRIESWPRELESSLFFWILPMN